MINEQTLKKELSSISCPLILPHCHPISLFLFLFSPSTVSRLMPHICPRSYGRWRTAKNKNGKDRQIYRGISFAGCA